MFGPAHALAFAAAFLIALLLPLARLRAAAAVAVAAAVGMVLMDAADTGWPHWRFPFPPRELAAWLWWWALAVALVGVLVPPRARTVVARALMVAFLALLWRSIPALRTAPVTFAVWVVAWFIMEAAWRAVAVRLDRRVAPSALAAAAGLAAAVIILSDSFVLGYAAGAIAAAVAGTALLSWLRRQPDEAGGLASVAALLCGSLLLGSAHTAGLSAWGAACLALAGLAPAITLLPPLARLASPLRLAASLVAQVVVCAPALIAGVRSFLEHKRDPYS